MDIVVRRFDAFTALFVYTFKQQHLHALLVHLLQTNSLSKTTSPKPACPKLDLIPSSVTCAQHHPALEQLQGCPGKSRTALKAAGAQLPHAIVSQTIVSDEQSAIAAHWQGRLPLSQDVAIHEDIALVGSGQQPQTRTDLTAIDLSQLSQSILPQKHQSGTQVAGGQSMEETCFEVFTHAQQTLSAVATETMDAANQHLSMQNRLHAVIASSTAAAPVQELEVLQTADAAQGTQAQAAILQAVSRQRNGGDAAKEDPSEDSILQEALRLQFSRPAQRDQHVVASASAAFQLQAAKAAPSLSADFAQHEQDVSKQTISRYPSMAQAVAGNVKQAGQQTAAGDVSEQSALAHQLSPPANQLSPIVHQLSTPVHQLSQVAQQLSLPTDQLRTPAHQLSALTYQLSTPAHQLSTSAHQLNAAMQHLRSHISQQRMSANQLQALAHELIVLANQLDLSATLQAVPVHQQLVSGTDQLATAYSLAGESASEQARGQQLQMLEEKQIISTMEAVMSQTGKHASVLDDSM